MVETVRALGINHRYHAEIRRVRQPMEIAAFQVDQEKAKSLVERARMEKRDLFLHEAAEVLRIYGVPIVQGIPVPDEKRARGLKPSDTESVVEVLLRLSQFLCDLPEIQEMDINPLRVFPVKEGCLALDVRMILEKD